MERSVATTDRDAVVIIGGGLVGIATAYYLATMGVRSTVIERDSIASHASGFAYGGLSGGVPNGPQANTPIIEYSMGLYPALAEALADETAIDIQYQPRPLLRLALSDDEATALTEHLDWQQAQPGYKVAWVSGGEARALEPRISPDTVGALHVEGTSDVEPYRLTLALAQAAEKRGVTIRTGEVTSVRRNGDRIESIALGGEHIPCDTLVIAMGPWSARAEVWLGISLPVRPLKGQIIRLRASGPPYCVQHRPPQELRHDQAIRRACLVRHHRGGSRLRRVENHERSRPDHRFHLTHAPLTGRRRTRSADRLPAPRNTGTARSSSVLCPASRAST